MSNKVTQQVIDQIPDNAFFSHDIHDQEGKSYSRTWGEIKGDAEFVALFLGGEYSTSIDNGADADRALQEFATYNRIHCITVKSDEIFTTEHGKSVPAEVLMVMWTTPAGTDPLVGIQQPLGNPATTRHSYELGTDKGCIEVFANSREQARKTAEKEGFIVKDVNMIG